MSNELTTGSRRRFNWGRLATGLVVIAALAGIVFAFSLNQDPDEGAALPSEIESLSPAPQSPVVPSQSSISADLVFGYDGVLLLNGAELPLDQLDKITAQAIISWTPGPDKEARRLSPGRQCAGVIYWPSTGTQERDGKRQDWCFNVN